MFNIIEKAKEFVGILRESINMVDDDNLFTVAIKGGDDEAACVSISKYDDLNVGSLAEERFPDLYKAADFFMSEARKEFAGISGVVILLTDEYETDVFQDGRLLRISNLDA